MQNIRVINQASAILYPNQTPTKKDRGTEGPYRQDKLYIIEIPVLDMLYLVTAEWIENPAATAEEAATVWKQMTEPSVKELARLVREKTIMGGVFAGERAGCFIIESKSTEELGQVIRDLPFWPRLKWNVRALESFESVNEMERKVFERVK